MNNFYISNFEKWAKQENLILVLKTIVAINENAAKPHMLINI